MQLKSTRKILSIVFAVIIAISLACFSFSAVLANTFAKQSFITNHIVTPELVTECDKQLDVKFDALEQKTGIPARVFATIKMNFSTKDALTQAAESIFGENDATLYNETRVESFYGLCVEYLEGNELEYNEDNVRNIADMAARAYSDAVGIHNADEIKYYIQSIRTLCQKLESISALTLAVSVVLILIIYKKQQDALLYVGAGAMAGGFGTIVASILAILTKVGADFAVSPLIYQQCFFSMTRAYMLRLLLAGFIVLAVGLAVFGFAVYKINLEQSRKDNRFSKIVVKL